jgi:hypothetical protein
MSFFEKSKILLEKTIHFTHFGVRPTNLTRLTFMLCVEERRCVTTRPLCSQMDDRSNFAKDWVEMGNLFFYNIGMSFFRDVFNFMSDQFTFYPRFLPHIY